MDDNEDEIIELVVDRPTLVDLEGRDALSQSMEDVKYQVQKYATASLPMVFGRMLAIATRSKNEKNAIEAAKFLKSFADGDFKEKAVEGQVKKLSDEEIAQKLEKLENA